MESIENSVIHQDVIDRVEKEMPSETILFEVSELFKVFGDSTRSRIICALHIEEMCVNDLSVLLQMSPSAISHQLKILRDTRLVKCHKQGRVVYYSLDDNHIDQIFSMAFHHVMEEEEG